MKIDSIGIMSFRSIVDQTISLKNNFVGLVGLNEAGKSNVLYAIRTLDSDYTLTPSDSSKITGNTPNIVFELYFCDTDTDALYDSISSYLAANTQISIDSLFNTKSLNIISDITRTKTLNTEGKPVSYTSFKINNIRNNILYAKNIKGKESLLVTINGTELPITKCLMVLENEVDKLPEGVYEKLNTSNAYLALHTTVSRVITDLLQIVAFWQYDNSHLIPSEISYDDITAAKYISDISVPLRNMFHIAAGLNVTSDQMIKDLINEWKLDSSKRRKHSDIINKALNDYILNVWQDYNQEISISLEENKMTVHIKDPNCPESNYYSMLERSQGFKTFVSFIMTMAADADSDPVYFMILDEPETHLHPSGVRFMLDELKKLSNKGNYVVFATHSIFMIDRSNLKNYIIVNKEHEATKLNPVTKNNITQESVIYESLGTTIDEFSISANNIMFEGELDRYIFEFYIKRCNVQRKCKVNDFDLLDGGGTKLMYKFFKDKNVPRDSSWFFVLDNDQPGRSFIESLKPLSGLDVNKQCKYIFYSDKHDYELDDILPKDIILNTINNTASCMKDVKIKVPASLTDVPISNQLNTIKCNSQLTIDQSKQFEAIFKDYLFTNISSKLSDIDNIKKAADRKAEFDRVFPIYAAFFEKFCKHI